MPKGAVDSDWLKKQVRSLTDLGDKFNDSGPVIEYGPYTLLKLICVSYYAPMFAKIARGPSAKTQGYDGAVYVDLFAGPGIVRVAQTGDRVAGSPIAATSSRFRFDYSVLVEISQSSSRILQSRLESFLSKDEFAVIQGDCNTRVGDIIQLIRSRFDRPIIFAFVDPEGMEAKWKTVEAMSGAVPNLDFMINVTTGASRVAGRLGSGMMGDKPIFEDFFGAKAEEILPRISQGEQVQDVYGNAVRSVLGKPVGETIPIRQTGQRIVYHLLAYTRASLTGSPWAAGFKALKEHIEPADGEMAQAVLDVVKGRQAEL